MRRRPVFFLAVAALLAAALLFRTTFPQQPRHPRSGTTGGVVVLDAGHGGGDFGALGDAIIERNSNLDMALRVEALLTKEGVQVVLTRRSNERPQLPNETRVLTGDSATFADLQARVAIANAAHADVFVSIHSNFWVDPDARGLEVWYDPLRPFSEQNLVLANLLLTRVSDEFQAAGYSVPTRGVNSDVGVLDAAGRDTPFFVLGPERDVTRGELVERGVDPEALGLAAGQPSMRTSATDMPGGLVELLFVSNAADAALLKNEIARAAAARGIASAVRQYLDADR